jgi:hypothetical protein
VSDPVSAFLPRPWKKIFPMPKAEASPFSPEFSVKLCCPKFVFPYFSLTIG